MEQWQQARTPSRRRELAHTPSRQAALIQARDGDVEWKGFGGLGGGYRVQGEFVFGEQRATVERLLEEGALEPEVPGPPRLSCRIRLTTRGDALLAKWLHREY